MHELPQSIAKRCIPIQSDPYAIDPLSAYAMDKGDLKRLLDRNPISKDDLRAILKSGQLSKKEIRELLDEYSK